MVNSEVLIVSFDFSLADYLDEDSMIIALAASLWIICEECLVCAAASFENLLVPGLEPVVFQNFLFQGL
jgi:hypothetical protein